MPGKVNPVIAESLLMVCAQVIGYDAAIVWCSAAGNFELNVMMPVMASDLLDAIELLAAGTRNFAEKLVDGLEADQSRAEGFVEQSLALGTALTAEIGYEKAAVLVKEAHATGRTIRDVAREKSGSGRTFNRLLILDCKPINDASKITDRQRHQQAAEHQQVATWVRGSAKFWHRIAGGATWKGSASNDSNPALNWSIRSADIGIVEE